MELHDTLYALGLQTGRDVFDDPDRLRGMLAQSGAPAAEVELVVDAVRRGAYRSMLAALDSGIDPVRAVQDAGATLARDRGSDPGAASWALAVLGFAVGRVGENDVRRHRGAAPVVPPSQAPTQIGQAVPPPSTHPRLDQPAPYQPPSGPPSGPPAAPYGQQPPVYGQPQQPYGQPAYGAPQPQPPYGAPQQPPHGQQQPWSPGGPPPRKSRLPLLLGVGGTLVAVIAAVVLAVVLVGGGDGDDEADRGRDSSSASSEATSEATSDPTTETTSESSEPTEDPGRVSDEAAAGYTTALLDFSDSFGTAGTNLQKATTNDNTAGAKAAARDLRTSVYDLDLATRALDLVPVQTEVNAFLQVSGQMIDKLDKIERDATTALDVNIGVVDLPITAYTESFQALADAIDASRA